MECRKITPENTIVLPPTVIGMRDLYPPALKILEKPHSPDINIDLSHVNTIGIEAMAGLMSLCVSSQATTGSATQLKSPEDAEARDWMRLWHVPEALESLSGSKFANMVIPQGTNLQYSPHIVNVDQIGHSLKYLLQNHFPFRFFAPTAFNSSLDRQREFIWKHYLSPYFLNRVLKSKNGALAFSNYLLYEAFMNPLFFGRPDGRIVTAASVGEKGNLKWLLWDPDTDLVAAIRQALANKDPAIKELPAFDIGRFIISSYDIGSGQKTRRDIVFDGLPEAVNPQEASDQRILTSWLWLYKTQKKGVALANYSLPATASALQGIATLFTGPYEMSMQALPPHKAAYQINIGKYPDKFPPFKGYMIVVDLPLDPRFTQL